MNPGHRMLTCLLSWTLLASPLLAQSVPDIRLRILGDEEVSVNNLAVLDAVVDADAVGQALLPSARVEWVLNGKVIQRGERLQYRPDRIGAWQVKANLIREVQRGEELLASATHMLVVTKAGPPPRPVPAAPAPAPAAVSPARPAVTPTLVPAAPAEPTPAPVAAKPAAAAPAAPPVDTGLRWMLARADDSTEKNPDERSRNTVTVSDLEVAGVHEEPCVGKAATRVTWSALPAALAPGALLRVELAAALELATDTSCDAVAGPLAATLNATFAIRHGSRTSQSVVTLSESATQPADSYSKSKILEWVIPSGVANERFTIELGGAGPAGSGVRTYTYVLRKPEPAIPLAVRLTVSKASVLPGEEVRLSAAAAGGKPPYRFSWSGDDALAERQGDAVTVAFRAAGPRRLGVAVTDAAGSTARGSAELAVAASELQLAVEPAQPHVGQEVRVTAALTPARANAEFRWAALPPNVQRVSASADGREIRFYLTDAAPARLRATAGLPGADVSLAEAAADITAKTYGVTIAGPVAGSPVPQAWREGVGLVPVTNALSVQQNISFSAKVSPAPSKTTLSYSWSAATRGCSILTHGGAKTDVVCTETGTHTVVVAVRDARNVEIGRASATFRVALSQQQLDAAWTRAKAEQLAEAAAKLEAEGRREEAAAKLRESVTAWPDAEREQRASALEAAVAAEKALSAKFAGLVKAGYAREQAGDLAGAVAKYREALDVQADERLVDHVAELDREIARQEANRAQAKKLRDEAAALRREGRLSDAVARLRQSLGFEKSAEVERQVAAIEKELEEQRARRDQATKLEEEGYGLEQEGRFEEAVAKHRASLALWPDETLRKHLEIVEATVKAEKARRAQASKLKSEAAALEKQGDREGALAKYRDSFKLAEDDEVAQRIEEIGEEVARERARIAEAKKLAEGGDALAKEGQFEQAVAAYRESLALLDDAAVRAKQETAEAELAAIVARQAQAAQLRDQAAGLAREDKLEDAVSLLKQSLKIEENDIARDRITAIEAQLAERAAKKAQAAQLRNEASLIEQEGRLAEAIESLRRSLELESAAGAREKMEELGNRLAEQEAREKLADQLVGQAAALEKKGDLAGAAAKYQESLAAWPDADREEYLGGLKARMAAEAAQRARLAELVAEGRAFELEGRLADALARYRESLKLQPDPALKGTVARLEAELARAGKDRAKADELRQRAEVLEKQGKNAEALRVYRQSLQIEPQAAVRKKIEALEAGLTGVQAKKAKAGVLATEAYALERDGKIREAIAKHRESLAAWPDEAAAERIRTLESLIAVEEGRRDRAERLKAEGAALEEQGRHRAALRLYRRSLDELRDTRLEERVAELERRLLDHEARRAEAVRLRGEGATLAARGRIEDAVEVYRGSLALEANAELEQQVAELEKKIAEGRATEARAEALAAAGQQKEQAGYFEEAIARYRESLALQPSPALEKRIRSIESGLAAEKSKRLQAQQLKTEGLALEQRGELEKAIARYRQSLDLWPDNDMAVRQQQLQARLDARTRSRADAARLQKEGQALERKGDAEGALAKYRESVAIETHADLSARITSLERQLDAQERSRKKADELWSEGLALVHARRIPEALVPLQMSLQYVSREDRAGYVRWLQAEQSNATARATDTAAKPAEGMELSGTSWKGVMLTRGNGATTQWTLRFKIGRDNRIVSEYRLTDVAAGRKVTCRFDGTYDPRNGRFQLRFTQTEPSKTTLRGALAGKLLSPAVAGGDVKFSTDTQPDAGAGIWRIAKEE